MNHPTRAAALAIVGLALVLAACSGTAKHHHPSATAMASAHPSAAAAASAAAQSQAAKQAKANLVAAVKTAFAPGQRHHVTTLIGALRADPQFASGAGRADALCEVKWLEHHRSTTLAAATQQATTCAARP